MSRPSTLLFVPFFNEQGRIGSLCRRIAEADARDPLLDELLLVDDGSTDGGLGDVLGCGIPCTVLRHPQRRGLGESFRTAYRHTLARGHEVFAVMAGNGKDDPADLSRVLSPVQQQRADYVQGSRFHPAGGRSERLPEHRRLAVRTFTLALSLLCRQRLTDGANGFRAYRVELLRDPRIDWCAPWLGSSYQVEIYLLVSALRLGYRVLEVPVAKRYPDDGRPYTKAAAVDWFRMVKPLVWCALRADRVRSVRRAPGEASPGLERVREGSGV